MSAKFKPSGGTGTGYTFSKVPGSGELEVASNGDVYIPASQTPLETGEGRAVEYGGDCRRLRRGDRGESDASCGLSLRCWCLTP